MDRDGIPERWNISMRIRKPVENGNVLDLSGGTVIMGFEYETFNIANIRMEALAIVSLTNLPVSAQSSVNNIKTIGTLALRQQSPLTRNFRGARSIYYDNLFSYLERESLENFLGDRYFQGRNETTFYDHELFLQRGLASSPHANFVDMSFVINVPREQQILYKPDVWEVLKFAWI
jgi:hypothetical protein